MPTIRPFGSVVFIHNKIDPSWTSLFHCLHEIVEYINLKFELGNQREKLLAIKCRNIKDDEELIYSQYATYKKQKSVAQVPHLVDEWDYEKNIVTPDKVYSKSHRKVWWKCAKCGHGWPASIASRVSGRGCPKCAKKHVDIDNCLATTNPELLDEWMVEENMPLTPYNVVSGSDKRVSWCCKKCGNVWVNQIKDRSRGGGCPQCFWNKGKFRRLLSEDNPSFLSEWHPTKNLPLTPDKVTSGSNKKVWWICQFGHEWDARINKRTGGTGCPECYRLNKKRK